MTPSEKRLRTIKQRYGSVKAMLQKRDVRDLILGGYNGGIQRGKKGFATWEEKKLKRYVKTRKRDERGRFVSETDPQEKIHPQDTQD